MNLGVVMFLDPLGELAVEGVQRTQVQVAGQELVAHRAEKSFDFSLGRAIPHRRVVEQAADAGADLDDFLGGVNGAVVHVERVRHAAFVEGGAEGFDERVHVFRREELAVTTDARGIINEGNEPGLHRRAVDLDIRPVERVGLPHFIGVGFGKGQPDVCWQPSASGLSSSYCLTSRRKVLGAICERVSKPASMHRR